VNFIKLEGNGTLAHWRTATGLDLLHPQEEVVVGGANKLRGGAPVCCPVFGDMPISNRYVDANLPKHGLVRIVYKLNPKQVFYHLSQDFDTDGAVTKESFYGNFAMREIFPWMHTVKITVSAVGENSLSHAIRVRRSRKCRNGFLMPLSMGLHPYFSTKGRPFSIRSESKSVALSDRDIECDRPIFIKLESGDNMLVRLGHGTIKLAISGGTENMFYIWTDYRMKYICVEPVYAARDMPWLLFPGDVYEGRCVMSFEPI